MSTVSANTGPSPYEPRNNERVTDAEPSIVRSNQESASDSDPALDAEMELTRASIMRMVQQTLPDVLRQVKVQHASPIELWPEMEVEVEEPGVSRVSLRNLVLTKFVIDMQTVAIRLNPEAITTAIRNIVMNLLPYLEDQGGIGAGRTRPLNVNHGDFGDALRFATRIRKPK